MLEEERDRTTERGGQNPPPGRLIQGAPREPAGDEHTGGADGIERRQGRVRSDRRLDEQETQSKHPAAGP